MRQRRGGWFWLMLLAAPTQAQAPGAAATWYRIVADNGATIGRASHEIVPTPTGREIVDTSEINIQELADPSVSIVTRTVVQQDATGRTLAIESSSRTGRSWSRSEARIVGVRAEIVHESASGRRAATVELPPGVRFDDGGGLLAGWNLAATPRLEFDNFSLGAMAVEHVVIEPAPGATPDAEGRTSVLRKRYQNGELRAVATLLLDRAHHVVSVTQPMFGFAITTSVTDRETALRPHQPYHVLANVMIRSPARIQTSALEGHIRFRFGFAPGLAPTLPQTGEQRVTAAPGGVIVDICAGCGPGLAHDEAALADARRPTAWMQSDDPAVRAIAAPVARLAVSDARKMELLLDRARPYLARIDFAGHYSALETIRRRAGDCTEASVLLGALGRAAGIPTRVVNGLVYARGWYHGTSNVFMPHSWTLAWVDGRWRSFDLALDAFDSSHIALTVGDGDARSVHMASQLASLLRWDGMTEVRARPAQ